MTVMPDELRARLSAAAGARYEVSEEIGRGGMGVVYRARDVRLRRAVAIKLLPPELAFREEVRSRFLREAQTAAQLGISFGTSTTFAVIVGFVIVALSMFSAVVDNVREFGTLKAMGARNFDLALLLWTQSLVYAFLGTTFGLFLVTRMAEGIRSANLTLVLPWWMWAGSYGFMAVLCILASTLALIRVRNVEPGMVFR